MNAVAPVTSFTSPITSNIPVSRFESLCVSGSTIAELLRPLDNHEARESFATLFMLQPRLRAARVAADRAMLALTEAKAEARHANAVASTLIDTAVRVGRLLKFDEIVDFKNQDDAWLFTVEGLVAALRNRGEVGGALANRFAEVMQEMDTANRELTRATGEYSRATAAFSFEYREFAGAINFARAVLRKLGVEIPRTAPKKKVKITEVFAAPAPDPT